MTAEIAREGGVRAIVFDFGGVFTDEGVTERLLRGYDGMLGLPPGTLRNLLFAGESWELASTGKITPQEHWQRTGAQYADRLPAGFLRFADGVFCVEPVDEAVVEIARELSRRYRLALCSNAVGDLPQVLDRRPDLRELFEVVVISYQVGLRKPDPAMYHLVAERLGLPHNECLLIDDKERNTLAACEAGMQAVTFVSAGDLRHQLERLGILRP